MRQEVGNKARSTNSSVRSLLRAMGRVAIWASWVCCWSGGLGAVLAPTQASVPAAGPVNGGTDQASAAFAVRFARTYLADPSPQALAPFLAEGASVGGGRPPAAAPR